MKYNIAVPYFYPQDINGITVKFKKILSGRGLLTMGKYVHEFEKRFADSIGTRFAIAANSCTSALEITLKAINIKSSDEVIVPVETFIATGASVVNAGGKVVFCDIDHNFLLDFEALKKKITKKTKAVIIVHFAGLIHPEIFKIKEYLKEKNIYLIEDAAHAIGARINQTSAGNIGDFGCFSFYATKIITTGEGGMITTNSPKARDFCDSLRNRGIDPNAGKEIYINFGSNRRMTEFQAILGLYQLARLEEFVSYRNKLANIYLNEFKPLKDKGVLNFQEFPKNIRHAYWRFVVFLKQKSLPRDKIKKCMAEHGITLDSPYAPLLHQQPVFMQNKNLNKYTYKKAQELSQAHFCLPMNMLIKEKDAFFIAKTLKKYLND